MWDTSLAVSSLRCCTGNESTNRSSTGLRNLVQTNHMVGWSTLIFRSTCASNPLGGNTKRQGLLLRPCLPAVGVPRGHAPQSCTSASCAMDAPSQNCEMYWGTWCAQQLAITSMSGGYHLASTSLGAWCVICDRITLRDSRQSLGSCSFE